MNRPTLNKSFISAAMAAALVGSVCAADWTVTTVNDEADNNCSDLANLSLRDSIACASNGQSIDFSVPLPGVISLGSVLDINKSIDIVGPGMNDLNISGNNSLFTVSGGTSTLSNLTLSNVGSYGDVITVQGGATFTVSDVNITNINDTGVATNAGNLTFVRTSISDNDNATLDNSGTLVFDRSEITNHTEYTSGSGAIYSSSGSVTITSSRFVSNDNVSSGGAIKNYSPSTMSISDSNFSNNSGTGSGGAIYNTGTLNIDTGMFTDNIGNSNGGAIDHSTGSLTIVNSKFENNKASSGKGGAISHNSGTAQISQSKLNENNASNGGGAIYVSSGNVSIADSNISGNTVFNNGNYGGGIYNIDGNLTVDNTSISNNELYGNGAGVSNMVGDVTITNSSLTDNFADGGDGGGEGGALHNYAGSMNISKTTISRNSAYYFGGGVAIREGSVTIVESTIKENNASNGGGIGAYSTSSPTGLQILNSTISGNDANNSGGGIYLFTNYDDQKLDVNISHTTIAFNTALNKGGGIYNYDAPVRIKNTILGANSAATGPDCDTSSGFEPLLSALNTYGYNLIENNSSCSGLSTASNDILNTPPQLLALADNGGPTWTHALDTLSPARGTGSYYAIDSVTPVTTDQRGFARPPALPSIGAFEPQAAEVDVSPTTLGFGTVFVNNYSAEQNVTVTNIGDDPLTINDISLLSGTPEEEGFNWTDNCGSSLAKGESCQVGVVFNPQTTSPYVDSLVIADTTAGVSAQVALSGTGTDVPVADIGVDMTTFDFGNVDIGHTVNYSLTVTNNGTADLTISSVSLQSGIPEFGITNNCTSPVSPEGSCSIGISFTPSTEGSFSDILKILSNDDNLTIPLYGYGYSGFELRFEEDITAAEYNAATALDPLRFTDENVFELRVERHDGLRRGMIDVVVGTPLLLNFYDFNATTKKYDTLDEENPFTIDSNYVMHFSDDAGQEAFNVKYIGSKPAAELNATIFGPNGTAYEFMYLQLLDEYRLEEIQYDYSETTEVAYTSITDFITDHADTDSYFMEKEDGYKTGLIFNYTSGATSGTLSEVENSVVTDATAGTWEITTVTSEVDEGYSGEALVVTPSDTENYHDDSFWAMESGVLKRGYAQLADDGFRFHWFDYTAHNEFVSYFEGALAGSTLTGTISLPTTYANDVTVTVFIDIMGSHDWISEQFTISAGQTQTSFSLLVPDGTKQFRVGYYMEDPVSGLVRRGYFSGTGTTAYEDEALIYSSSSIPSLAAMTVMEGHTISGTVTLPTGFYAEDNDTRLDVVASVDVLGASALFRHQIMAEVKFVENSASANFNLTIPDTDKSDRYFIAYDFFDGTDFIRQGYYSSNGMTPYFSDATAVDTSSGDVSGLAINILDGVTISGTATINATSSLPTYLFVRAMRDDGYEVFGGAEIPAGATSVSYRVDVPETATAHDYKLGYYVLQEDSPNIVDNAVIGYWSSAGTVTNKTEAGEFGVSGSSVANKNFTVAETDVQTVPVSAGWNLLSLPSKAEFSLFDMILHFGFRQDGIINMARYGSNGWSYYMVNGWEETVNRFNSLESGEGFWLQASNAFTQPFALADDADYADEVPELKTGWNLVGVNKDMSAAELVALYSTKGYTTIESIWTYKSGIWRVYIPDVGLDTLVSDLIPRMTNVTRFDGIWINLKGVE